MLDNKTVYKVTFILSAVFIVILSISFVICSCVVIIGQFQANKAIVEAGQAIISASQQNAQSSIDFTSALNYLESAQQQFSENSITKVTSFIYVLVSTIILGYATQLLHLGSQEKKDLVTELTQQTEEAINKKSKDAVALLQKNAENAIKKIEIDCSNQIRTMQENFAQEVSHSTALITAQKVIYNIISSSKSVTLCCFLLQSSLSLLEQFPNDITENTVDILERFQIELIRAIRDFRDILRSLNTQNIALDSEQKKEVRYTFSQLKKIVSGYTEREKPEFINDDDAIRQYLIDCENESNHQV